MKIDPKDPRETDGAIRCWTMDWIRLGAVCMNLQTTLRAQLMISEDDRTDARIRSEVQDLACFAAGLNRSPPPGWAKSFADESDRIDAEVDPDIETYQRLKAKFGE